MVSWPRGLGNGLQNRLQRFESARNLKSSTEMLGFFSTNKLFLCLKNMIKKHNLSVFILLILHLVGIIGLNLDLTRALFLQLTPITIFISSIILIINVDEKTQNFILFFIVCFLFGYFIELIGVKSKLIFGEYQYGKTLGTKIFDIPIIMGLNWFNLIFSIGVGLDKLKNNIIIKSTFAALVMTTLDFLIEPVAIQSDFWSWKNDIIPVQNYLAWFASSFFLFILFYKLNFSKKNKIALTFIIIQFLFFLILNLLNPI
jgi:bisanhydrobacterioruberin hydratase